MDQSTINSIYFLLVQSLIALTDGKHCQDCLSSIRFKLNPLYWPNKSLEYGLEKYFGPTSLKKHLLENLLRIIHNCRFFLEESLYRLEINPNEMMYQTLYDPFIEVLLNLRFGVFFTHVPRISHFSTLTENGLQVKIRSIKRFFYPKVKDLIVKLSKYCTHPLKIRKDMITCHHQSVSDLSSIKFHKEDWQDRTGPIYPPSFRKYYFCKICYVNESNKCLH